MGDFDPNIPFAQIHLFLTYTDPYPYSYPYHISIRPPSLPNM
jgi:hypothetical protein